jgi:hypothetical protein
MIAGGETLMGNARTNGSRFAIGVAVLAALLSLAAASSAYGAGSAALAVTTGADLPPIGGRLDTVADDRGTITLDGKAVEGTTEPCDPGPFKIGCAFQASYAVFDRETLEVRDNGNVRTDAGGSRSFLVWRPSTRLRRTI